MGGPLGTAEAQKNQRFGLMERELMSSDDKENKWEKPLKILFFIVYILLIVAMTYGLRLLIFSGESLI